MQLNVLHSRSCWPQLSLPRPRDTPQVWTQFCAPTTHTATRSITRPMFLTLSPPATTTLLVWVLCRVPTIRTAVTTYLRLPRRDSTSPDSTLRAWAHRPAPTIRSATNTTCCWTGIIQTAQLRPHTIRPAGYNEGVLGYFRRTLLLPYSERLNLSQTFGLQWCVIVSVLFDVLNDRIFFSFRVKHSTNYMILKINAVWSFHNYSRWHNVATQTSISGTHRLLSYGART